MAEKNVRKLKVYSQSGYNYENTPTIVLKGKWLEIFGFEAGDKITVKCENGKLMIERVS